MRLISDLTILEEHRAALLKFSVTYQTNFSNENRESDFSKPHIDFLKNVAKYIHTNLLVDRKFPRPMVGVTNEELRVLRQNYFYKKLAKIEPPLPSESIETIIDYQIQFFELLDMPSLEKKYLFLLYTRAFRLLPTDILISIPEKNPSNGSADRPISLDEKDEPGANLKSILDSSSDSEEPSPKSARSAGSPKSPILDDKDPIPRVSSPLIERDSGRRVSASKMVKSGLGVIKTEKKQMRPEVQSFVRKLFEF